MTDFAGLAIECSGSRIAVGLFDAAGALTHERSRVSDHEHARHLLALIEETLAAAGRRARDLSGIAIDVGPGSFTALRVGLATARGLAHPFGTPIAGVTAFAALLAGRKHPRRLVVPLLVAGRTQVYAGFYRGDPRGDLSLLRGPAVGTVEDLGSTFEEALALCPRGTTLLFVGPGAARERASLEARHPGSTEPLEGAEGPTVAAVAHAGAVDLARGAAETPARTQAPGRRPARNANETATGAAGAGVRTAAPSSTLRPLYVRAPQAVENAASARPVWAELSIAKLEESDLDEVLVIENTVFTDPWPRQFFLEEMRVPQSVTAVVRHRGKLAAYLLAWRLDDEIHLGNFAVAPEHQRRGIGQYLLDWLLEQARSGDPVRITLEVRSSNFAAQELYRRNGFRAVALRHGYYQDTGEDALIMMRDPS
ncbi:MAG: tRNA (adenosine(37)-N6)-threonylcarbamoyltransferase complex dimerization subunit type 1 TsaB [Candidatus Eiseniibacteriota bacterium]